jgi:hypothetical protein
MDLPMTNEDLQQHAAAWQFAAELFVEYEERWSGTSLQAEASAHRRLCMAVAGGYRQQIGQKEDKS